MNKYYKNRFFLNNLYNLTISIKISWYTAITVELWMLIAIIEAVLVLGEGSFFMIIT